MVSGAFRKGKEGLWKDEGKTREKERERGRKGDGFTLKGATEGLKTQKEALFIK
jgi:hypothetical protein